MPERRRKLLAGMLILACGLGTMVGVFVHPERVNGPAWLGHVAGGTFVLTGLAIVCQERGYKSVYSWLVLGMLVCLFSLGAWVAFGPGARACAVALPGFSSSVGGLACRGAFGLGAVLVGVMALWQFLRILRR
jgi:hypothetical protein